MADTGRIVSASGAVFEVEDVQVAAGYVLHIGQLVEGEIKLDEPVTTQ